MAPKKQQRRNRLLLTDRPRPGESFIGFLLRLTELNGYENLAWIPKLSGIGGGDFYRYNLAFRKHQDLNLLSDLTGASQVDLASLLYKPVPSDTPTLRSYAFGLPISKFFIRPGKPKICPACLREYGYCHKVWELAPVTACPDHGCLLLDECPNCRKGISWCRKEICLCACGYDWRNIKSAPVDSSALSLSQRIHVKCGLPIHDFTRGEPRNPLDELDLEDLVSAVSFIAAQHTGRLDTKGKFTGVGGRNEELHEILTKAASVFEEWPKQFEQFIVWRQNRFSSQKKPHLQTGLHKDFGTFFFGLYSSLPSAGFDFMRTAFETYIEEHWDGGYTSGIRRHSKLRLTPKKYVGLVKAARMLETTPKWINFLIESNKLEAVIRIKGKKRIVLIGRTNLELLKREYDKLLGMPETAELLGVNSAAVRNLIQHGCLLPLRGRPIDGFKNWKFSRESISELLERIEKKIVPQETAKSISFPAALAKARRRCSVGGFVKMILDGVIIPCAKSAGTGLYKFSFPGELMIEEKRAKRRGVYNIAKVAKLLNGGKAMVRFLIKKGIFPTKVVTSGQWELSVDEEGVNIFISTYTLASNLATTLHTSPELVVDALEACRVFPVSGMKIDGGPAYVFLNSDLEPVNLAEALSKQRAKYRPTDTRLKVNIEQAANILGVDVTTIRALVDNGVLKPYVARSDKSTHPPEIQFTTYTLERFKKQFTDNLSIATEMVATR